MECFFDGFAQQQLQSMFAEFFPQHAKSPFPQLDSRAQQQLAGGIQSKFTTVRKTVAKWVIRKVRMLFTIPVIVGLGHRAGQVKFAAFEPDQEADPTDHFTRFYELFAKFHFRRLLGCLIRLEIRFLWFQAFKSGNHAAKHASNRRVVFRNGFVVAVAFHGNSVFCSA